MFAVAIVVSLTSRQHAAEHISAFEVAIAVGGVAALLVTSRRKFDDVRVLVISDVLRLASCAFLLVTVASASMATLVVVGLIQGAAAAVFRPHHVSLLKSISVPEITGIASQLRSLSSKIASLAGPSLAALICAVTRPTVAIGLNIPTFLFSLVGVAGASKYRSSLIERAGRDPESTEPGGMEPDAGATSRFTFRPLLPLFLQGGAQALIISGVGSVLIPIWLAEQHATAILGLVVAASAAGAMLGTITYDAFSRRLIFVIFAYIAPVGEAVAILFDAPPVVLTVAALVSGLGLGSFGTLWLIRLQTVVPERFLSRAMSIDALAIQVAAPLGLLTAGLLLSFGAQQEYLWIALAVEGGSAAVLFMPAARSVLLDSKQVVTTA